MNMVCICQFGQWIKLQYIVSLPPDKLWWNLTALISIGLSDGARSHVFFSNIMASSSCVYGCGCGHEYMCSLFPYDNMSITLSRGFTECLQISLLLQLAGILIVKLFITCPHPLAGQRTMSAAAPRPVGIQCLAKWHLGRVDSLQGP